MVCMCVLFAGAGEVFKKVLMKAEAFVGPGHHNQITQFRVTHIIMYFLILASHFDMCAVICNYVSLKIIEEMLKRNHKFTNNIVDCTIVLHAGESWRKCESALFCFEELKQATDALQSLLCTHKVAACLQCCEDWTRS